MFKAPYIALIIALLPVASAMAATNCDKFNREWEVVYPRYLRADDRCMPELKAASPNICKVCRERHDLMWKLDDLLKRNVACQSTKLRQTAKRMHALLLQSDRNMKDMCGY
jgi:hypothetical protein